MGGVERRHERYPASENRMKVIIRVSMRNYVPFCKFLPRDVIIGAVYLNYRYHILKLNLSSYQLFM